MLFNYVWIVTNIRNYHSNQWRIQKNHLGALNNTWPKERWESLDITSPYTPPPPPQPMFN